MRTATRRKWTRATSKPAGCNRPNAARERNPNGTQDGGTPASCPSPVLADGGSARPHVGRRVSHARPAQPGLRERRLVSRPLAGAADAAPAIPTHRVAGAPEGRPPHGDRLPALDRRTGAGCGELGERAPQTGPRPTGRRG